MCSATDNSSDESGPAFGFRQSGFVLKPAGLEFPAKFDILRLQLCFLGELFGVQERSCGREITAARTGGHTTGRGRRAGASAE
jgi:hypothetical protein